MNVGAIVHYRLTAEQAEHRIDAQSAVGTVPLEGDVVPLVVTRVDGAAVNGQALFDGDLRLWVQGATEGTTPGTWTALP
jgi:hypothetical protein